MTRIEAIARAAWSRPYPLLVFTVLCWGANAVAGRIAVGEVSPMAITCLRWLIVVAVLALANGRTVLAELPRLKAWRWRVVLSGAFGFTGFNASFYVAAHTTSAVNIGLIQGAMPAMVMLGSVLLYRNQVGPAQIAGLALATLGVVIAVSHGSVGVLLTMDFAVGDLFMLIAAVLYSGYALALRTKLPVAPLTFFSAVAGAALVTSLPLLAWEVARGTVVWPTTAKGLGVMLFIALVPSLLSQITFMRGVALVGPARAGLFINLVPIFAAGLAVLVLGEPFGPDKAVALATVLAGIALAEWGRPISSGLPAGSSGLPAMSAGENEKPLVQGDQRDA